jgi:hypothetical protein
VDDGRHGAGHTRARKHGYMRVISSPEIKSGAKRGYMRGISTSMSMSRRIRPEKEKKDRVWGLMKTRVPIIRGKKNYRCPRREDEYSLKKSVDDQGEPASRDAYEENNVDIRASFASVSLSREGICANKGEVRARGISKPSKERKKARKTGQRGAYTHRTRTVRHVEKKKKIMRR